MRLEFLRIEVLTANKHYYVLKIKLKGGSDPSFLFVLSDDHINVIVGHMRFRI